MADSSRAFLVTGAANGIGKAVAIRLASEGDHVYAADVDGEGLAALGGLGRITPLHMDVTDRQSVAQALAQVRAEVDGLDGLVHCAGIIVVGSLVEVPEEQIERAVRVNVLGMARVNRQFFPLLHTRRGRIVVLSSEVARFAPGQVGCYTMSKFAIEGYCHSLRRELMLLDMPVIVIQPGSVRTQLTEKTGEMFLKIAPGSLFEPQLRQGAHFSDLEYAHAVEPDAVAAVILTALHSPHPKVRYRINNDRLRAFLSYLPETWADALLKRGS
jgi:NAD(P)-dependent dehydrogenase (short-subunit alcohol dehydrogenase family)